MTPAALTAIFDALPDPAMVVRVDPYSVGRRVVMANAAAREMFRIAETQPMIASVIRRPDLLDLVEAALSGEAGGEVEWETADAVQDRSYRAIVKRLALDEEGARAALVIVRDETDARRNERMRADFLANASHELKTPLASLAGFIETLRGHARDDKGAREKFLAIMAVQVERLIRLVGDLMSLSRIELNEHIPPTGTVDLGVSVADVADALAPIAAGTGVSVSVDPAEAAIVGDSLQIVQVLQNLIENAIKHSTPGGQVRVDVLTDQSQAALTTPADPGAAYRSLVFPAMESTARFHAVRITNPGEGIPREYLPRLTERFYRAPGQKSGEASGTGLGLAIVKHIVGRHHGGLFVESAEGKGAAFTVYFRSPDAPSSNRHRTVMSQ
jgi:two-component system phosphate regulon sensor histidine kinase PhoR